MSAINTKHYMVYASNADDFLELAPKHWQVWRLKDKATFNPSKSEIKNLPEVCTFAPMEKLKTDSLITDAITIVSETSGSYTYFKEEDILIAKVTPCFENRNIAIAKNLTNGIGFGSSEINVVRVSKKANRRWFFYLLLSSEFIETGASKMAGAGGLKRIPSLFLETFSFALPPISEQTAIVSYLDTKTAQIDRKIDLLNQKTIQYAQLKKSLINETVTRGLNKSALMKDSGVLWIGKVPEHWKVTAVTNITETVSQKNYPNEELLSVYRDYGVIIKSSRDDNNNKAGSDLSNYKLVEPGFLVINKMKAWQGSLGVSEFRGIVSPAYITCMTNKKIVDRGYLHHLLRSRNYINEYNRLSYGVRVDQWDMRYDDFKYVPVLLPPMTEQIAIAAYLDTKIPQIDHIITTINNQIDQLKELRKVLINDVVTGKIKVIDQG